MSVRNVYLAAATLGALALTSFVPTASAVQQPDVSSVIVDWNQLAQRTIAGQPFAQVRQYALLHVAMADAVVAIEGKYDAFMVPTKAPHGASATAAAAQAAHDVLAVLYPLAAETFKAELEADLAGIAPGPKAMGVQVGQKVAAWVLAERADDGAAAANPSPPLFTASTLPGIWQQTLSGPAPFSNWQQAEPFGLLTSTQFLPVAFPQLESTQYATDVNKTKNVGRRPAVISTDPAAYSYEQRTALLWAGGTASGATRTAAGVPTPFANVTNLFRIWYSVTRDAAAQDKLSLVKTARLYALVATSIHDSLQTAHVSKFAYRLWRPETAIVNADQDNNPLTDADPSWVPLLITPPYPSHSSNMTCVGAGAARMLANVFGTDEKKFTAVWYRADNSVVWKEDFTSFKALAVHEGNSRVWGGIHFDFELAASHDVCSDVADYIFDHKMQPDHFRRW